MPARNGREVVRWSTGHTVDRPHRSTRRKTQTSLSKTDWESCKELILDLYYEKNNSLADVMHTVQKQTGFEASQAQYRHALEGWRGGEGGENKAKYLKLSPGQRSQARTQRKDRVEKEKTKHAYQDLKTRAVLDTKKVEGILRRHEDTDKAGADQDQFSTPTTPKILVFTPKSVVASPVATSASAFVLEGSLNDNVMAMDIDPSSCRLQTSPQRVGTPLNNSVTCSDRAGVCEIDLEDTGIYTFLEMTGPSVTVETSHLEGSVPIHNSDTGQATLHSVENSPTTPSWEFFGFQLGIDFSGGFILMVDLPYFELQTLLIAQGPLSRFASPGIASGPASPLTSRTIRLEPHSELTTNVSLPERHGILAGILGRHINGSSIDLCRDFTSHLAQTMPQQFQGEIESRLKRFFNPSLSNNCSLQYLFEFAAFYISNEMLSQEQIKGFLKWVVEREYIVFFIAFLRNNGATIRALSKNILGAAILVENMELLQHLHSSGVKFDEHLSNALRIKDEVFVEHLLLQVDSNSLSGASGGKLLLDIASTDRVRIADILIKEGVDVNFSISDPFNMGTPIHRAVGTNKIAMARFLLQNGADVNILHGSQVVLSRLIENNYYRYSKSVGDMVTLLLDHGARVEYKINKINPGLASIFWDNEPLYRLLRNRADKDEMFYAIGDIILAARWGKEAFLRFLHNKGPQLSRNQLESALSTSVGRGELWTTSILLECGVDPNCTTLPKPPLVEAATGAACGDYNGSTLVKLLRLLVDAGACVNAPDLLMWTASAGGESGVEPLEFLINAGADVVKYGADALTTAVRDCELEVVATLLVSGAPIDAIATTTVSVDDHRLAPIQVASLVGNLELTQYLHSRGADVNTPAFRYLGLTALQAACMHGEIKVVEFLLQSGADVNARSAALEGFTALEAVFHDDLERDGRKSNSTKSTLFTLLLEHGADPLLPGSTGPSLIIHRLVEHSFLDLLESLLQAYTVDPNVMSPGKEGRTPLQLAAGLGRLGIMKVLVARGADVNHPLAHNHGRTALQAATSSRSPDINIVKYLLEVNADVHAEAGLSGGITAMQGAAIAGCIPIAELLLEKGADVNERPSLRHGRTALEGAAEHGRIDMVQWLINHGARGDVIGATGYTTARKLAQENGYDEIVKLLKSPDN